jgi:hypothetical protein
MNLGHPIGECLDLAVQPQEIRYVVSSHRGSFAAPDHGSVTVRDTRSAEEVQVVTQL